MTNPRQLINEIRNQINSSDNNQKVLANYSTDPELWGYSKVWLFFMLLPSMIMFRIAASYLTGTVQLYGLLVSVVLAALAIGIALATPSTMDIERYLTAIVSHYAHQQTMIYDSDPDTSRLEQPKNDSLLGRIARLPLVRDWPIIGAGEYRPTQDLVAHKKPYRGEYAIQRDDGTLIGAIRVFAIPLRMESNESKQKVSLAVADALEAAVDYDAQLYSPVRVADFERRKSKWASRAETLRSQAEGKTSDRSSEIDRVRKQILADVCEERAAVINLHEEVKRVREYYVLVSVDPSEAVIDRSAEEGGLGSIPGVGRLVEEKRLREQADSEEHIDTLIRKLKRRVNTLSSELARVEGISTQPLSAIEFSEQVADYYRSTNVRAHKDFSNCIRVAPVPNETNPGDADDPEHDVSYQHISNFERSVPPSAGSNSDSGAEKVDVETTVLGEDALVGGDDDWHYKSALAPDSYERAENHGIIDDKQYTTTLEVRDWPAIPTYGFLDPVTSFSMPAVNVTMSTHLTGEDAEKAERELSEAADSFKDKVYSFAENRWIPDVFVEKAGKKFREVKSVQQTVANSEYGLYTSHTYFEIRAPSPNQLETAVGRIRSRLQDVSADATPLKHNNRLGYRTVAPACNDFIGGNTKMVGDGLARLIPWTARNLIEPNGIELGINEDTGDPIVLDLMNRETGFNVGLWATIGGGKTTTMTRILLHSKLRNPDMPVVIIDPLQEFAGYTWLFDGERVVVGSDTGINPLQIDPIPPEKLETLGEESPKRQALRRAMDFIRSYYNFMGISFEEKQGTWRTAIKEAYARRGITDDSTTHDRPSPTLRDDVFPILEEMVHTPEKFLRDALAEVEHSQHEMKKRANSILMDDIGALEEGGEFAHLSKETEIDVENIDVLYLDLQQYESESTAGLMMGPLISAIYSQAQALDEPMLFGIDEFHYMLRNSSSLETLKQLYRHSRHSELSILTATQSVDEFFTEKDVEEGTKQLTSSAKTLINLMSVKIFHYLKEMDDQVASEFDFSEAEQQYISEADTGNPTAQALLQVDKEGSFALDVKFADELNPREFAANQFDPTDHGEDVLEYLNNYTDQNGNDVCDWSWTMPRERPDMEPEARTEEPITIPDAVPSNGETAAQSPISVIEEVSNDE